MIKMKVKTNKKDVLFWAYLHPNKRGSFEDYIVNLASECSTKGISIKFVFGNDISNAIKRLFRMHHVEYDTLKNQELNSMKMLIKILREIRPAIVHLNFISPCSYLVPLCRLMGVKKVILADHTSSPILPSKAYSFKNTFVQFIKYYRRRLWALMVNRFIAVSAFVAERLIADNGISRDKIRIIYNGVDLERFSPPTEKDILRRQLTSKNEFRFIVSYIGQLTSEKGVLVFLDSANEILKKRKDILFLITGNGPQTNLLKDSVKKSGISRSISFLGTRDDVEVVLRASDIYVCPSVWGEAFGLSIVEAMATGVPVIASNVGGIPEIIKNCKTGILVSPNDRAELAKTINGLLENAAARKNLAIAGRRRAEERFSIDKMAGQTIKLYQELLANG